MDSTLLDLFNGKYERGGKTPGTYDCRSLFIEVMHRLGNDIRISDVEHVAVEQVAASLANNEYPYTNADSRVIDREIQSGKWEKLDVPERGCAVCIALDAAKPDLVQHLGVYIGNNKFIHILQDRNVSVTDINDRFFRRKIRGYYRWKP